MKTEAGFPRVAELHRLESDLIGEYSDDEGGFGTALESKASSLSIKMEAVVEESAKQLTTALSSDVEIARQTINHHVAHEELQRLEQLRSPVSQDANTTDDRSSIEISRQTRVAVPASELAKPRVVAGWLRISDEFVESDQEEEDDATNKPSATDPALEKRSNGDTEIWNRYPSSSSSEELELQLPFPDEPLSGCVEPPKEEALRRSSAEAAVVESHEVNPFVEPASPSDSEGEEEHVDRCCPRCV
ncbi:hypothetical protein PINS_up017218 [Pythium insidiosum]|nr:hypothetical protein PINS_up017218 [Pythium insidiosum]